MVYHNLKSLGHNTLNIGDIVYFRTNERELKYSVQSNHLSNYNYPYNEEIFLILDIEKESFCNHYYGYQSHGGDWPTCKPEDYIALTAVVKALYKEIESRKVREITKYPYSNPLIQELKTTSLSTILSNPLLAAPLVLEKKEETSSNIVIKRKSKVKRIIGEEFIRLNNY